jgi:hypothetical protein
MKMHALAFVLLAACADSSAPADELTANDDTVDVELNTPTDHNLLDNDIGVDPAATVDLTVAPLNGMATIESGVLKYTPGPDYMGDDTLAYRITNPDGTVSQTAIISVHVTCATCATEKPITLTWTANPPEQGVTGYRIYFGTGEDVAGMTMVDDIGVTDPGFDNTAPKRTFDAWSDFKLRYGETACFRMTAYNSYGESDYTGAACLLLTKESAALVL